MEKRLRDCSRVRRFPITMELLMDIFTTGQTVHAEIVEGIPKDSMIVRHHYDNATGFYWITVQNDSFEPVKQGDVIPVLQITVKNIEPERAGLPSAEDLDAVAAEQAAANATAGEAVPA